MDLECLNEFAVQLSVYFWLKAKGKLQRRSLRQPRGLVQLLFLVALVRVFFCCYSTSERASKRVELFRT